MYSQKFYNATRDRHIWDAKTDEYLTITPGTQIDASDVSESTLYRWKQLGLIREHDRLTQYGYKIA